MKFFNRDKGNPDPEEFFEELKKFYPGKNYKNIDRYGDFRTVFLGSEQGKRVLYEIFSWGRMYRSTVPAGEDTIDVSKILINEGQRNLCLKILATMNAEPSESPVKTNSKE